jgi:hypothetical protein
MKCIFFALEPRWNTTMLALPPCKLDFPNDSSYPEIAGKLDPLLYLRIPEEPRRRQERMLIATTIVVPSIPTAPSDCRGSQRLARMIDGGVCATGTIALPQCKLDRIPPKSHPEIASKQEPLVLLRPHRQQDTQTVCDGPGINSNNLLWRG